MSASDTRFFSSALSRLTAARAAALLLAAVVVLVLGGAAFVYTSSPDVAYIDSRVLMERYDKAVAARKEISAEQAGWNQNVQTLQSELGMLNQELVEQGASWSDARRKAEQDTLEEKRRELMRYRRAVREKTEKLQQETMKPVYSELNADIKAFGKEKGYDIILGTLQGGNILFADEATNVTERFLDYANPEDAGNGSSAPADEAVAEQTAAAADSRKDGVAKKQRSAKP